jgi:glycyl-tRNA synthetase beta chain
LRPRAWTRTPGANHGADTVYVASDGKADYLYLRTLAKGQPLARGLQDALDETIARLPIPKVMSYARAGGYYNDVKFVRPAHRLLALHDDAVVPVTALGLAAGRVTAGHRFFARDDLSIASAAAYEETLRAEGKVIPSLVDRRAAIASGLERAAGNATVVAPETLLDEVTALVEWPVVYEGTFDPAFLAVPQECLILTMQQNQKYFALEDGKGQLLPRFLLVSNTETADPRAIVEGNERSCAHGSPMRGFSSTRIARSASRRGCRSLDRSSITTSSERSSTARRDSRSSRPRLPG